VFHKDGDYTAFADLLAAANERLAMCILGYILMPNHFHLVLWTHRNGELSRWMQRLMTSRVRRYHQHYHSSGHVWQGRFKAFPIEQDEHLHTVLRYAERNPLRAGLVERAEEWPWSSLAWRVAKGRPVGKRPAMLAKWPIVCPRDWIERVNAPITPAEVEALQHSIDRGAPFGDKRRKEKVAVKLGIESALRPRGRPRKAEK
jgi:putative transposase